MKDFILQILVVLLLLAIESALPVSADIQPAAKIWKSGEPYVDHIHTNGKTTISFLRFATCIDAGLENAISANKPLFVYVRMPGCPDCAAFELSILAQPNVRRFLTRNFVLAEVLRDSNDDQVLKRDYGMKGYPHFFIFSKEGQLLGQWSGTPKSAKAFVNQAEGFAAPPAK